QRHVRRYGRHGVQQERDQPAQGHADDSADQGQRRRFHEKLPHDRAPGRAQRFADANLARAFGDRNHHDRDDADTSDHESDEGQGPHQHLRDLRKVVYRLRVHFLRNRIEVAFLTGTQASHGAHGDRDVVDRALERHRILRHDKHVHPPSPMGYILHQRAVRNHDLGAIGTPKQAGWGIVDADDVVRQTGGLDVSYYRVALAEWTRSPLGIYLC